MIRLTEKEPLSAEGEAVSAKTKGSKKDGRRKSSLGAAIGVAEVNPNARVGADAFVRVCITNGFHSIASSSFKEVSESLTVLGKVMTASSNLKDLIGKGSTWGPKGKK